MRPPKGGFFMRCLIIDDVHPRLLEGLKRANISVDYQPEIKAAEVHGIIADVEILVVRSKVKIDALFLSGAKNLKCIGRAGAGLDNIDLVEATNRKIQVFHAAEGNADAVAEHTLAMVLMLLNKIMVADRSVRNGEWSREFFRGEELSEKTVGILGYGNMGTAVAARLQAFNCRIIAFDKYRPDWPEKFVERVDWTTFTNQTEILTIHLPLTGETRGMVNQNFINQFQKPIILIHTSRGPIVSLEALLKGFETGKIRYAGLDVLENEPPVEKNKKISSSYQRLFDLDQVIFTPHVAGWSLESYRKISEVLSEKISSWFSSLPN